MEKSSFLVHIISWLTVVVAIFTVFEKASDALKKDSKVKISNWLMNIGSSTTPTNWPLMFALTFDGLFSRELFSKRFFFRSCLASLFSVAVTSLIVYAYSPSIFTEVIFEGEVVDGIVALLFFAALLNFIPDYISLLETRLVIKWMSFNPKFIYAIALLFFDFIATSLIFMLGLTTVFRLQEGVDISLLFWMFFHYANMITFSDKYYISIFFYTTFFTSFWVWLYAFSGFLIGIITRSKSILIFFKNHLAIEEKPLRSMALVIVLIVTFGYLLFGFFYYRRFIWN